MALADESVEAVVPCNPAAVPVTALCAPETPMPVMANDAPSTPSPVEPDAETPVPPLALTPRPEELVKKPPQPLPFWEPQTPMPRPPVPLFCPRTAEENPPGDAELTSPYTALALLAVDAVTPSTPALVPAAEV